MKLRAITVTVIILSVSVAFAAPDIAGVSGPLNHGSTVTIWGTDLEAKATAEPVAFLNFEGGSAGSTVSEPGWTAYADAGIEANKPKYSAARSHSGGKSMLANPQLSVYTQSSLIRDLDEGDQTFYLTFWYYASDFGPGGSKAFRLTDAPTGVPETVYSWTAGGYLTVMDGSGQGVTTPYPVSVGGWTGKWFRIEYYFVGGTQGGADGSYWFRRSDGITPVEFSQSGLAFLTDAQRVRRITFGAEFHSSGTYWQSWSDDFYIDNTQARVEACAEANWASRKVCDIQPMMSRSDTSIAITLNTSSFTNGQTIYLFVVDGSGSVNAIGYPVTVGETGGGPQSGGKVSVVVHAGGSQTVYSSGGVSMENMP